MKKEAKLTSTARYSVSRFCTQNCFNVFLMDAKERECIRSWKKIVGK